VKVEAFARNKAIHVTETCHDFPVLVRVTAPWRCMEMPIDVYVDVIVVSNIGMDQVNEAVMALIDRLNPNDRLSILFCGRNGCEQVMELTYMFDHGQDFARLKINELAQSHVKEKCTYYGPALPMAAEVRTPTHSSMIGLVCFFHIFLLERFGNSRGCSTNTIH
jgi:hypothetical protein